MYVRKKNGRIYLETTDPELALWTAITNSGNIKIKQGDVKYITDDKIQKRKVSYFLLTIPRNSKIYNLFL